ncbi:hypothetical protein FJT64_015205 [Amphibalanus amphitrite]|uniref:Uncharacterized protein n=1 Tax=Amphibalanus amphitrite TaxID=1232801 RepID=A0A6A4X518_AMPAM|nr:hypothetical protein FJT64_015205 [Amphibalanus amphitrite]
MSCASFIPMSDGRARLSKSPPKTQYDHIDEHAALIGLQALSLNLESANRGSEPVKPQKKCLKPLKISTTRKTPEKHVSISPMSATPRSSGSLSGGKFRASPCRSDSSGFQSLPSPVSAGSHCGSHISDGERLFTNHSNVQVMTRSRSRQSTPQPRQVTPRSRQDSQGSLAGSLEEYATVFDVQNILRKGELVETALTAT